MLEWLINCKESEIGIEFCLAEWYGSAGSPGNLNLSQRRYLHEEMLSFNALCYSLIVNTVKRDT
jgi:hypothetical protein